MNTIAVTDDDRLAISGPYALKPGHKAELAITSALAAAPHVRARFVPYADLPTYLAGRKRGTRSYPADLSPFAEVALTIGPPIAEPKPPSLGTTRALTFATSNQDGVYVIVAAPDGSPDAAAVLHVVIASRALTKFPAPGVDDLAEVIVRHVNASAKNGILYLVFGAVWFAEHMLNIEVASVLKAEIAHAAQAVPYLPVDEDASRRLLMGRPLGGVDGVWLESPADEAEAGDRPCFDLSATRETPAEKIGHA